MLRDASGRHLVNTRVPLGTALPAEDLPGDREVRERRKPVVTGIVIGSMAREPVYNITAAVVQNGKLTHFLSLSLPPERLAELLKEGLDPGHIAGIFDQAGMFLARSEQGMPISSDNAGRPRSSTRCAAMRATSTPPMSRAMR